MLSPAWILARYGLHIAVVVGVLIIYVGWKKRVETKAVTAERVRVETTGKQIDAKAQAARRDAERRPHDSLLKYYRD